MGSLPDVTSSGLAALIVAFATAMTAMFGAYQTLAGKRNESRAEIARKEIDKDRQELEERRYADTVRDELIARLREEIVRQQDTNDRWYRSYQDCEVRGDHYRRALDDYRDRLHIAVQALRDETIRAAAIDGVTADDVPQPPDLEP